MDKKPRVVVLGGGNGTSRLLGALLPLLTRGTVASLHALVHMADDGGSTGRLREQYGVAAVGDLTKCLIALSAFRGDVRGEAFLKALEYRFDSGDFAGHTLRNHVLTALEKTSDIDSAIATLARILQVPKGAGVLPITLTTLTQQVEVVHGQERTIVGTGEHFIAQQANLQADPSWQPGDVWVTFVEKDTPLNPRAEAALKKATHIVIAPGHTYGTILPTLALPALGRTLGKSRAQLVIIMTLLTTPQQTSLWRGEDFVRVYEAYLYGKKADVVITNTGISPVPLIAGQSLVTFKGKKHHYALHQADLMSADQQAIQPGDRVPRAIVVHDQTKLMRLFAAILK